MESTHFINNQQRVSQKQLQLHLQQKQKRRHTNDKYCLDSPTNKSAPDNYQQQQQSQCPRFTSLNAAAASSPTTSLIPADIATNHHNHPSLNHFATTSRTGGCCEHTSPAHHCANNHQLYHQSNSKNYPECATLECQYCSPVNHNEPSVDWSRKNISATMEKYEPSKHNHHHFHHHHHNPSPTRQQQQQHHRGHKTLSHPADISKCKSSAKEKGNCSLGQSPVLGGGEIQSEYAYAYYEPGAPMRHRNIPTTTNVDAFYEEAGPSCSTPAGSQASTSIRAIISTARRNALQRKNLSMSADQCQLDSENPSDDLAQIGRATAASSLKPVNCVQQRSSQVTRTQENLYEEIKDEDKSKILMNSESIMSFNQYLVEEEFRRVHFRHRRVLDELNLDVEEMLMPSLHCDSPSPPTLSQPAFSQFIQTSPVSEPSIHITTDTIDFLGHNEDIDCSTGAGSYSLGNNFDLDSGFSGSNSGNSNSSYIGSLRYQKSTSSQPTAAATATALGSYNMKSKAHPVILEIPINHQRTDSASSSFYGSSMMSATDEIAMISMSSRSSSANLYDSSKMMNKLKALTISPTRNFSSHHHHHQPFTPSSFDMSSNKKDPRNFQVVTNLKFNFQHDTSGRGHIDH